MSDDKPLKKPVDYDELFPGRFLKAGLFGGKQPTFTIRAVNIDRLPTNDNKTRVRGIVEFAETEMGLVLNSTNGQCLRAMFGRRVQGWVGKRVTLCSEQDSLGGKMVDAIRVVGSPDLQSDVTVAIELPQRRPRQRALTVTRQKTKNPQSTAPPPREPGQD